MTDPWPPQPTVRFILASASQGRYETLVNAGVVPQRLASNFDESSVQGLPPRELVQELANRKADVIATRMRAEAIADGELPQTLVLGCDSLLEFEGDTLGKPRTQDEVEVRWKRMRGRSGVLHTGHCLIDVIVERVALATASTKVHFSDITDDELEVYRSSGEPSNVAGGFTVDGFGGWFIDGVEGDHHNVVGLSLPVLRKLLRELDYGLWDLGYPTP
ncbi:MAG: septum formation inhibitor Maf [Pseudonocardiales bacterium]|nr:MAG: septum formation inhibitor Maf [Pseudonocardiales bacterium]